MHTAYAIQSLFNTCSSCKPAKEKPEKNRELDRILGSGIPQPHCTVLHAYYRSYCTTMYLDWNAEPEFGALNILRSTL